MSDDLKILLDAAETHARDVMLEMRKQLPPTWILFDGKEIALAVTPWEDNLQRSLVKFYMAHMIKEQKTRAYCFISEVWVARESFEKYRSGEPIVEPRLRPDRKEMVLAFATDGKTARNHSWEIVRNYEEQITELKLTEELKKGPGDRFGGWMISLLGVPTVFE
jgi:hypothetical protein